MKVKELVERLQKIDQELEVYTYDPESGRFEKLFKDGYEVMSKETHSWFDLPESKLVVI